MTDEAIPKGALRLPCAVLSEDAPHLPQQVASVAEHRSGEAMRNTDPIRRLATRISKDVVKTLREGGAVVATPEELRASAKAHILRKRNEAVQAVRDEWGDSTKRQRSMPTFDWGVAHSWLDDWNPDA